MRSCLLRQRSGPPSGLLLCPLSCKETGLRLPQKNKDRGRFTTLTRQRFNLLNNKLILVINPEFVNMYYDFDPPKLEDSPSEIIGAFHDMPCGIGSSDPPDTFMPDETEAAGSSPAASVTI